jgi:hypothetical protein
MTFVGFSISNRLYSINYEWKRIFIILFGAIFIFLFGSWLSFYSNIFYSIVIKMVSIFVCSLVLYKYFILTKEEKLFIIRKFKTVIASLK